METIWADMRAGVDPALMKEAGRIILDGGLVAFPTETVYGLGANALYRPPGQSGPDRLLCSGARPYSGPCILAGTAHDDYEEESGSPVLRHGRT